MKAQLQTLFGTAVLGLVLVSNSLPAWAGVATRNEVYISPGRTNAQGSLTGARYSADSEQFIGCDSHSARGSTVRLIYCFAKDKRGITVSCASTDPRFADAVKGMTDSSHLDFRIQSPSNPVCADLTITNGSIYLR